MSKLKSLKGPTPAEIAEREKQERVRMQGDQLSEFFKLRAQLVVALASRPSDTPLDLNLWAHRIARQEFMSAFECTVTAMQLIGQEVPESDFYKWLMEH